MSDKVMESDLLVELSTEEQQLLSGGQLNLPARLKGRLRDKEGNKYPVRLSISEPIESDKGERGSREF